MIFGIKPEDYDNFNNHNENSSHGDVESKSEISSSRKSRRNLSVATDHNNES